MTKPAVNLTINREFEDTIEEIIDITLTDNAGADIPLASLTSIVLEVFDTHNPATGATPIMTSTGAIQTAPSVLFDADWETLARNSHPFKLRVFDAAGKRWTPVVGDVVVT